MFRPLVQGHPRDEGGPFVHPGQGHLERLVGDELSGFRRIPTGGVLESSERGRGICSAVK